jgi:hypothetical protein
MFSYRETTAWWTAPSAWASFTRITASTRGSTRGETNGGTPATPTSRQTSSVATEQGGLSTASSSSTVSTRSSTGPPGVGGGSTFVLRSTFGDTSSSNSGPGGTASGSFSRSTALSATSQTTSSLGWYSTSTGTSSTLENRTWPSTLTLVTTTGTAPATGTTTTRTCSTFVTADEARTRTTSTAPTSGQEYTALGTYTTSTGTSTVVSHAWMPLTRTVVHANGTPFTGNLLQDAIVWRAREITADSTAGLFTDFFTLLAEGTTAGTAEPVTSRISVHLTEWRTFSLSTAVDTFTATTGTFPATGTVTSSSIASSLDGAPWDTAEISSTTIFPGDITGSTTFTVPGPATLSGYTFTRQTTSYDGASQIQVSTFTDTAEVPVIVSYTWKSWERSTTTTGSISYPVSTTTLTTASSYSSDGWRLGTATLTSQHWQTLTTSYLYTHWDGSTNAVLNGSFTSTGSSGGGGNATTESVVQTVSQTWARTNFQEVVHLPVIQAGSLHEFTRFARFRERQLPRGFLGFGDGFSDTSPVHAGLTSSVASGSGDPAFSLVASAMPRFVFRPDASIFATGSCWLENHPISSTVSATWLSDTATGPRLTASLAHRWVSTGTTTSGVTSSTVTTSTALSATYVCGVTGSITGEFFREYEPWANTTATGIGTPILFDVASFSFGGPAGGRAGVSSVPGTAFFPAGGLTLTWESAPGLSTSSSTSTSSGELTVSLPSGTNPVAFAYEEALRFSWIVRSELQLETASRHYLPAWPWEFDLQ